MATKYALPLTFVYVDDDEEPEGYAALACEVEVVSCGADLDDARYMIQDAIGLWATHEIESGRGDRLSHPISPEELTEFIGKAPPQNVVVEYYTLVLDVEMEPQLKVTALEFVRSSVTPFCHLPRVAA